LTYDANKIGPPRRRPQKGVKRIVFYSASYELASDDHGNKSMHLILDTVFIFTIRALITYA
jgi:hypothetical protein